MLQNCAVPGLIAVGMALLITPVVMRFARSIGLVDAPDGFRKLHQRTVVLGGGAAVVLAVAFTSVAALWLRLPWAVSLSNQPLALIGASCGALLVCFVGLIDDRYVLRGRQKLVGQIAAAMLAVAGGIVIPKLEIFGFELQLGLLAVPVTICWLLGAVNALNLIDGVDGLATSIGILQSIAICIMAAMMGNSGAAAAAAIIAGALIGFLPYNWSPARIFLGDAGSMFIGFSLGILAIRGSFKGPATVALIAPTAIWAIPLFDVGIAILRRKLTGQSIYTTDRGHLHHVLQRYGLGHIGTVLVIAAMSLICGVGALASVFLKSEAMAVVVCGSVLSLLVLTRSFGHAECGLLLRRMRGFAVSCWRLPHSPPVQERHSSRFHGNREFDQAWESLVVLAERFDLSELNFNVNAPMFGEVFHANWQRRRLGRLGRCWETEVPLVWKQHEIGRLKVTGIVPEGSSPFQWSGQLMESFRAFETQVLDLFEVSEVTPVAPATFHTSDPFLATSVVP
ncbi:MAG TPA: MraY family glycosyltransferase [Planctomycetaceae bacterium]|nr:MraY family glycosyltransferase [Planctomycetaceae bacterium]